MAKIYKVNVAIDVMYGAVGAKTGLSDLTLTPTNPSGSDQTPITMTEVSNGLYKATFTPDVTGRWKIRITSSSASENGSVAYYWVGDYSSLEGQVFILTDADGDVADVTSNGRLLVSQEPPTPPPDTTSVKQTEYGNVSVEDDNEYTIPNGETIIIQRLSAGAEQGQGGNVIELWYDPNGNKVDMQIIDVIFSNGDSDQHDLNDEYTGDGTRRIVMRRRRLSGGANLIFSRWEGYY